MCKMNYLFIYIHLSEAYYGVVGNTKKTPKNWHITTPKSTIPKQDPPKMAKHRTTGTMVSWQIIKKAE